MRHALALVAGLLLCSPALAQMPNLDSLMKGADALKKGSAPAVDDKTGGAGIKEALAVGTENAVKSLSKSDGYFANEAVKILMPDSIKRVADVARMAGFQKQVDEFVLSMNRAAEAAAPAAAQYFGDAIRAMTLDDVRGILSGGDTAATDFFRSKTQDKLYAAFKPVVSKKVGEVGATKAYTDMMGRFEKMPMGGKQSLDLEDYVTKKALDGLFLTVAKEEKNIRSNPAARTTDLLKKVFGK
jgi:hypothetical protein